MDGYKLGISMDRVGKIRKKEAAVVSMDRSAQNCDRSSECELMNLRRMKFVFDVAPLEIIDDKELFEEDEAFFHQGDVFAGAAVGMNINQINLVIHAVNHGFISQYWSLKSNQLQQQLQQLQLNSSSCRYQQHHRDHHHLRDDDDDEEMIMIACRPPGPGPPKTADPIILLDRASVFASSAAADDDCIMSQLRDLDLLYEIEWIFKQEQLEEVKRCIIQRISEAKPALLLLLAAKPNTALRIRVDLSSIFKRYFANPAAAASEYAEDELHSLKAAEDCAIHYPAAAAPPTFYDDVNKRSRTLLTTALRSSKEALETKILEEEDLISSSSSSPSSCSVCLDEFRVGVDEIKKMPCSHVFHWNCLMNWLWERNTCPLCYYQLPTFWTRFLENQFP